MDTWSAAARSRSTRWQGAVNNESLRISYRAAGPEDSRTNRMLLAYRYTAVHSDALLYCCSGLVGEWWESGGGARGWVE